ncbi:MAG: retron system putative HNH endonuclease [Chloroflexota bacterium]
MIKLSRGEKPTIWTDENIQRWTENWQKRVAKKTDWSWPQVNKQSLNHVVTEAMVKWHHHKCAFCERQVPGELQIEHFKSKQHYPQDAFDWVNLFLSCGTCNGIKGEREHDPCLKPDDDDPSTYLWVNPISLKIEAKPGISVTAKERANYTVNLYGLDRPELRYAYLVYWRTITLHDDPPSLLALSNPLVDTSWVAQFIHDNFPEIKRRAQPTEEYSLMVRSLIDYIINASVS